MPQPTLRSDDPWNLRPYDVPWGEDYYDYEPGKLPGHDGLCLVLRSPTPVEQKRTAVACKHCRQRKAKCSGDRPACSRCADRGRRCIYPEPEEKRQQPVSHAQHPGRLPCAQTIPLLPPPSSRGSSVGPPSGSYSSSDGHYGGEPRMKMEPDVDAVYHLYNMPHDRTQLCEGDFVAGSPDSGYSSPPSLAYSDVDYDFHYSGHAHPAASPYTPPVVLVSSAIFAPTPIRPATTTSGDPYVHRPSVSHVAVTADPTYGYQDLSVAHGPLPSATHEQAFAESVAVATAGVAGAGAPQQLAVSITGNSGVSVPPPLGPTTRSHAYSTRQEPVGFVDAESEYVSAQYSQAHGYNPATWFNGHDGSYYHYPLGRQSYTTLADPASYASPINAY